MWPLTQNLSLVNFFLRRVYSNEILYYMEKFNLSSKFFGIDQLEEKYI